MPGRQRTRRRTLRPETIEMVDLAAGMCDALTISEAVATRLTKYLFFAVVEWRVRSGEDKGWLFTRPAALDLYEVAGSDDPMLEPRMAEIAAGLCSRGFKAIRLHWHSQHSKPIACRCAERTSL
jgi:hypothetical protein